METCLGPKFECATRREQRLHSRDPREKELTSDNSQEGLLLPPHDASRWKVSTQSIEGQGAHFPRLPDFAGKASGETGGNGQGKYWKDPHSAGGGDVGFLPGGLGTKRGAGLPEPAVAARPAARSPSLRRSPRPAPQPAARLGLPLPRWRASCHGDQTCLCALRRCDFLILRRSLARAHSQPHAHATPTGPRHQTSPVFPGLRGRARAGASAGAAAPDALAQRAQHTHTHAQTLAPARRAWRREPRELAPPSTTIATLLSRPAKLFFPA